MPGFALNNPMGNGKVWGGINEMTWTQVVMLGIRGVVNLFSVLLCMFEIFHYKKFKNRNEIEARSVVMKHGVLYKLDSSSMVEDSSRLYGLGEGWWRRAHWWSCNGL